MNKRNRWKAVLPSHVSDKLNELRKKKQANEFQDYLVSLRAKGWSLSAIATPTGLSRERIRQLDEPIGVDLAIRSTLARGYDVPELPVKPVVVKPERVIVEPNPVVMARLRELQTRAQSVRGNSPKYRSEAEEYTKLIANEISRGVFTNTLAKELGVTHSALRFRLVRYGYMSIENDKAGVYRQILSKNRVQ